MRIYNRLIEESFDYSNNISHKNLNACILSLDEIYDYLENIGERLYFDACIYSYEIEDGKTLMDWLWNNESNGNGKDYRDLLEQILTKPTAREEHAFDEKIEICLYPYENCVSTKNQYIEHRRKILIHITDKNKFLEFMQSCFMNSVFSNQIETGFNTISDFNSNTAEIVKNLSVLNDEALNIFLDNRTNISVAYEILSSKLLECAPDPENTRYLQFAFINDSYNTEIVECSPHMKLIRKDSDLRIYFYWCHPNIGKGKRILIGRIGTHPY